MPPVSPGAPMRAPRRHLSPAQKRVVEHPDIEWVGWDAKGRPVVGAYYRMGFRQPLAGPHDGETDYRVWALTRAGDGIEVSEPVERPR